MIALAYLGTLLVSTGCMALLDHRFRLVFWSDARRATVVMLIGVAVFLLWDVAAIGAGFYYQGDSPAMTGIQLAPELPLEEFVFITFLCYITLVLHGLVGYLLGLARSPRGRAQ